MENTTYVFSTNDAQEVFLAQSIATFLGGYCYRASHLGFHQYWGVISKQPLSNEQVVQEILKDAARFACNTLKAHQVLVMGR